MGFLTHLIINTLTIILVSNFVAGFIVSGWLSAIIGSVVLGFVNTIVRPIALFLTIPLTIITLGLFLFVLNGLMLLLTSAIVPGFQVTGLVTAIVSSLLISIVNALIFAFLPDDD